MPEQRIHIECLQCRNRVYFAYEREDREHVSRALSDTECPCGAKLKEWKGEKCSGRGCDICRDMIWFSGQIPEHYSGDE